MKLNPLYTSLKTLTITYKTPQETLLPTPQTLPTAKPATAQVSYTVTAASLPALGIGVHRATYVALVYIGGKFPTAGTLYREMVKNGVSIISNSSAISANQFYTLHAYFFDVKPGDVLEVYLWSSVTDSNWDYSAFQVQVSRIIPLKRQRLLQPCNFTATSTQPTLTLGTPAVFTTRGYYIFNADVTNALVTAAQSVSALYAGSTSGIYRLYDGDAGGANSLFVNQSSTARPYYNRNTVATTIVFRGVSLD
jgi:hypothetical protein